MTRYINYDISAFRALDKKFKVKILSCNLCIQHIETTKNNFLSIISIFESLTSVFLKHTVSKTHFFYMSHAN